MSKRLKDKVALITGWAQGLGKEMARLMLAESANVIIADIYESALIETAEELSCSQMLLDVTKEKQWQEVIEKLTNDFGALNILVNNAGIGGGGDVESTDLEAWNIVHQVNLDSVFLGCKYSLPLMRESGNGSIINISSISGTDGNKGQGNYAASKGGLLALTKSLAKEVGRRNITVNCIAPGLIETDMISHLSDTIKQGYLDRIPLKKLGKPEDIGQMILFLCSDEASYITGQTFYIDGGMSLN